MNMHILKQIITPRTSLRPWVLAVAALAALTLTPAASAQIQTVPPGLNPGDSYRLVFVTSTTRDASSANIADYNTFVSGRAAAVPALAALSTTWKAIAATSAVDVRANTATDPVANAGTSVPIYQLGGLRVADGYTDLWDDAIANAISMTETGTSVNVKVWTGVGSTFANEYRLGTGGWNWYGKSAGTVKTPVANRVGGTGWTANLDQTGTTPLAFYAISDIITVPLPGTDLLSFIWDFHIGVIDQEAKTVSLTVPYGTDLTTINPTCTVSSGATLSPASEANAGFTESNKTVTYTVSSGESHTDYAATVTFAPPSTACDLLTITAAGSSGTISGTNVTLIVPYSTDVTTLAPTYTVSQYAKGSPTSGTPQNFTASQDYIVTAQDGSTSKTYTVTVHKLAAPGTIATVPPGLQPGDSYRLVFVTSTTRDALSTSIADYNTFVAGKAAAVPALVALSATWKAIGSTPAVNANANTLTRGSDPSAPIYRLDGALVADGNSDLWNASTNLYNSISITEAGNAANVWVWTGTTGDGTPWTNNGGRLGDGGWILDGKSTGVYAPTGNNRTVYDSSNWVSSIGDLGSGGAAGAFYAISDIITVPLPGTDLLSFIWDFHIGVIDQEAKTVSLTVPYGTDLTTINPICLVSSGASVSPASGANAGFTESNKTVTYTVTSGTSHTDYAATVTVGLPSSACDMLTFNSGNYSAALVGTHVTLMVPYGTDVMTLAPTYTMSPGATGDVSYPSGSARDFTTPQTYTITAQNGTDAKIYTVSVLTVPVTVPRGLNPGDSYRLVFVTNGTRDALSTNIADYNGFVTTAAAAAPELGPLATTWTAIAATSVDVRTNTATDPVANAGTSVPIYNLGGVRVADGYTDLWDDSIANAISITETGNGRNAKVWTGVGSTFQNEYRLGGAGWCYYGSSTGTVKTPFGSRVGGTGWTANLDQAGTASLSLYAISDILTVPAGGSAACTLLGFSYGVAVGVIDQVAKTVLLTAPYSAPPLTAFVPAVSPSAFATFTPTGARDFSNSQATPVAYTVTAENGIDFKTYQVTVVKAAASTACDMVSFTAAGVSGVISAGSPNTVTLMVPLGTDLATITPTVVVSPLAAVSPAGLQDFTNSVAVPVNYTVTAEDGTSQKVYAVTIIGPTPPPNDNFVNAIALPGASGIQTGTGNRYASLETDEPAINGATHTVWFKWTAPSNGSYAISTVGSTRVGGGEWDAMLGIYTGSSVDALTAMPGLPDGNPQDNDVPETMTMTVTAGTTYHIQAAGYENQEATNIKLTCTFVSSGVTYNGWALTYAGGQTPDLDFNHDGVSNGVAYFMGMDGHAILPGIAGDKVTWPHVNPVASFEVQVSNNLSDWTPATSGVDTSDPTQVVYTLPIGAAKTFCRLMVVP